MLKKGYNFVLRVDADNLGDFDWLEVKRAAQNLLRLNNLDVSAVILNEINTTNVYSFATGKVCTDISIRVNVRRKWYQKVNTEKMLYYGCIVASVIPVKHKAELNVMASVC